ncbi:minor capsid protein [Actinomadura terrae]|uniref:minor capsid protein n=1 Tax=Actinomadura terrae TaxID=604353 RepID=UPI001FA7C176|nr:minor capsid protein [Actinomadura terrae]
MSVRNTINFGQFAAQERAGAVRGLALAAEHLLQVSRTYVPLEEGTLERSGVASVDPSTLEAAVSYDTPYAVRQHEDLDLQHDDGRKAKYLEDAMTEESDVMAELVAAELRRALGT